MPGRYVLEVLKAETINRYAQQVKLRLRVADGEHEGHTFFEYPKLAEDGSVKVGSKAAEISEACLGRHLAPDEKLDTEDLIGTKSSRRWCPSRRPARGPHQARDHRAV